MKNLILLVDDDAHILETAQDIMEAAGFAVQTAENGAAALKVLKDHACRVMIVDFNLLDTTGIELAVKARDIQRELVVVLMTGEAHVDLGPAQSIIRAILTKPVNPSELIDIIHKILDS